MKRFLLFLLGSFAFGFISATEPKYTNQELWQKTIAYFESGEWNISVYECKSFDETFRHLLQERNFRKCNGNTVTQVVYLGGATRNDNHGKGTFHSGPFQQSAKKFVPITPREKEMLQTNSATYYEKFRDMTIDGRVYVSELTKQVIIPHKTTIDVILTLKDEDGYTWTSKMIVYPKSKKVAWGAFCGEYNLPE